MIVIIDEGIDKDHPRLKNCRITGATIIEEGTGIRVEYDEFSDSSGHGTAVAAIIHKIVPETDIYSIKMFSPTGRITENLLSEALLFCNRLSNISVVNISMGVAKTRASTKLYDACLQVYQSGITIVAASHNFVALQCYPAAFPFVYAVGCGLVKSKLQYHYADSAERKILAKGGSQRIAWKDQTYKISAGTSFATAHFSGILEKIATSTENRNYNIDDLIKSNSTPDIEEFLYIQKKSELIASQNEVLQPDALNKLGQELFVSDSALRSSKLAVFPASEKEIKTVTELSDSMSANLVLAIDYPRNFADLLKRKQNPNKDLPVIARELKDNELHLFDTIAIGYFMDMPVESNIIFGTKLIEECLKKNKNILLFDNDVYHLVNRIIQSKCPSYTGRIRISTVDKPVIKKIKQFSHLPDINVPVLAVIGTSSRQGKFTTQIRVREIIQNKGYKVSLISTEPQGVLFDAAFTFPYGYNSNIVLPLTEWHRELETIFRGVQHFNKPNIILTGIQGGVLPRKAVKQSLKAGSILSSMHYLTSVAPDAVFCSVNPTDSVEHIQQTIETVYNFCKSPCLLCMMTPLTREFEENGGISLKKYRLLGYEEMKDRMDNLSSELGIPVINVMDTQSEMTIISAIEDFFS